jgi:hypothetical protein
MKKMVLPRQKYPAESKMNIWLMVNHLLLTIKVYSNLSVIVSHFSLNRTLDQSPPCFFNNLGLTRSLIP